MIITLLLALLAPTVGARPQRRAARHTSHKRATHAKKKTDTVAEGAWGGQHVQLDVTGAGATVQYDCGHGAITEPLALDAGGRFDARGTHVREHGGPVRVDEKEQATPARFRGRVEGDTMTLTVTLEGSKDSLGTFTLRRGEPARLFRCM